MKIITLLLVSIFCISITFAQDSAIDTTDLKVAVDRLQFDVDKIKSDQINYKIANDLLEKTFHSNYSTIQLILTVVIGLFTILSYFGFRGIRTVKKDFDNELTRMQDTHNTFKSKLDEFIEAKEKMENEVKEIIDVNKIQEEKITLIEIKEKITSLSERNEYTAALKLIDDGLKILKDDTDLLFDLALIKGHQMKYSSAIDQYNKIMDIEPTNVSAIVNSAEMYLLSENIDEYDKFVKQNKSILENYSEGLLPYFNILKLYLQGDNRNMETSISNFKTEFLGLLDQNLLGIWQFDDLYDFLENKPDSVEKTKLIEFCKILQGKSS